MEISRTIRDAENVFRDFLEYTLDRSYGDEWLENCGIPLAKIDIWRERKAQEEIDKAPNGGEERLIYYAPFQDLYDIVNENWVGDLQSTFVDRDTLLTYLKIIEEFRNPDKWRRELFVYQKHLILGISGDIRSKIAAFRSMQEVGKEGYPRIEYIKDSLGNIWVPGKPRRVKTNITLHPGDQLEFIIQAHDPEDQTIEYRIHGSKWQTGNILFFDVAEKHIKKQAQITIAIRSGRKFHAYPLGYDDRIVFEYQILPKDNSQ